MPTDKEKEYFSLIIENGLRTLNEIYNKFNSLLHSEVQANHDCKNNDIEDIINKLEKSNNSNDVKMVLKDKNSKTINEINYYIKWKKLVRESLESSELTNESFRQLVNMANEFHFKTDFLERFKLLAKNFTKDRANLYIMLLFEEDEARSDKHDKHDSKINSNKSKKNRSQFMDDEMI